MSFSTVLLHIDVFTCCNSEKVHQMTQVSWLTDKVNNNLKDK